MPIFKDALEAYAKSNQKQWDDQERLQTVGASEVGQCARKIGFDKNQAAWGITPDDDYVDSWGAKVRGSYYENFFWAPAINGRFGDNAYYTGEAQRTFVLNCLSATPDSLICHQPRDILASLGVKDVGPQAKSDKLGCFVMDCKSIDPRATLDGPKPEHVHQVISQIGLIRDTTDWRPQYGVLTYTNASFWDEVHEFVVTFDQAVYDNTHERAANIIYAEKPSDLEPEGWIAGGKDCQYCKFKTACGIDRTRLPSAEASAAMGNIPKDAQNKLILLAQKHAQAAAAEKQAVIAKKSAQHEIKAAMTEIGRRKAEPGAGIRISWAEVKGRSSMDTAALKQYLAERQEKLETFQKAGVPGDRLTIKVPGFVDDED